MASSYDEFVRNNIANGEKGHEIYCICRSSHINTFMISCDFCREWFHGDCVGVSETIARNIDLYFCKACKEANPNLKTTYKKRSQRKTNRKRTKRRTIQNKEILEEIYLISNGSYASSKSTENSNECELRSVGAEKSKMANIDKRISSADGQRTMSDEELVAILKTDTTRRKAKTIANENLKLQNSEKVEQGVKSRKRHFSPRQCYGPECVKAARDGSKYCSDECGLRLGKNRILEILPARIQQRKILPCAADESSRRKLATVRQKRKLIHRDVEHVDIKIMQLLQLVQRAKSSEENAVILDDFEDDHSTVDCKLCGTEIPTKVVVKHLESCYRKQERRILLTGTTTKPDDEEWNIFCNYKMGRQGHCKQLRVLCPLHNKESKDEDGVCGYPFRMDLTQGTGKFCGRPSKSCPRHPSCWEEIFRAELDMEKLKLLLKLSDLEREEMQLRQEMAARGNLMALMMHSTTVH